NLARTVPANWTGTLSASSVTLAPGASANATLNVKSVSSATAGGYGIGAGVSSTAGSTHTASAASTYTVASDTTPPPATGLTESVGTDKASYIGGETVYMSARVLNNGQPVAGATVKFTATKPNGIKIVKSATSGADGYARKSFVSGTGSSSMGTYQLSALATSNGSSVTANSTFTVSKTATTPPPAPSPEPTPEPTPAPTGLVETVGTDKASYIGGQTVNMSARVLKNGVAVSGATVKFTATKPDGYTTIVMSTTTGSDGYARKSFNSGTGGSSMGTYQLKALATSSGTSVTATNSFKVSRY
ncbi:MAG: hypothetical protein ACRDTJ_17730, partial [Pseudonocardiaceae bacterium]